MRARPTVVIDAFPDSAFRHRDDAAIACIDVLLGTTTLATAAEQGRPAAVAASAGELSALAGELDDPVLAGRLPGVTPAAFETQDGPCALLRLQPASRPVVVASVPGTELVANAAAAGPVLLACFRNLSATARALARHRRVALLAAGWHEEVSCEDQMAAAWIAGRLLDAGFAAEDRHTADIVRRWSGISPALAGWGNSAAQLRREGRGEEVDFVLSHVDDLGRPCWYEGTRVFRDEVVPDLEAAGGTR